MGRIVEKNRPCLSCTSSDALQIYEDGGAKCFSCEKAFTKEQVVSGKVDVPKPPPPSPKNFTMKRRSAAEILTYKIRGFEARAITKDITTFYGVRISYNEDGNIDHHYYPYESGEKNKIRKLPKEFSWEPSGSKMLFGQEHFNGGGKRLIICEGECDTLAVAEASYRRYNKFYPIVGISSSAMAEHLVEHRSWIRSFKEVVICFDEDDAGHKAQKIAAKIVGYDKALITKLPKNDANEVLVDLGEKALMSCIFDSASYTPSGIIKRDAIWAAIEAADTVVSIPYPPCLAGLNSKIKGMRGGEIALFISGTGSGKSTLMREIILHTLETSEERVGIVSLEESPGDTGKALAGMQLRRNRAIEEIPLAELKVGFDQVFAGDRLEVLDHQGSVSDGSVMDRLEYMCLVGCKKLFIDHITILVSEGTDNLQGNEAQDKIMNDLLRLVKKYPDVWIGLVSHLRKTPNDKKSFEDGRLPSLDDIKGCLARDTKILLSDGTSELVQNLKVGNCLIGDNGQPRQILKLKRGSQQMYRVTTKTSNDSFICNEDHVLTVSRNDKLFDISVEDFLNKSDSFQHRCKQHYSEGYDLPHQELLIPPYSLGAWLGDGSKSAFRIMDAARLGIVERVANELGVVLKSPKDVNKEYFNFITETKGEMLNKLKDLALFKNKHIPSAYQYASRAQRLELLAGLLDTDGSYSTRDSHFYFYQKEQELAKTVKSIARSLGLYSTMRSQIISSDYSSNGSEIFQVMISGNIDKIPTQKVNKVDRQTNALKRGITVEALGVQDYYGFVLDGNGRFLLGNHTITHNSGSTKQIPFDIIAFARPMTADSVAEQNCLKMSVLKARTMGLTGRVPGARFIPETGRYMAIDEVIESNVTKVSKDSNEEDFKQLGGKTLPWDQGDPVEIL